MCGSNQNWESVVMKTVFTRFVKDESGATAIEYGLIAAIVGVGIIVGLTQLRDGLNGLFGTVSGKLTTAQ
jgi:pilus assembly protein Flp/PilA